MIDIDVAGASGVGVDHRFARDPRLTAFRRAAALARAIEQLRGRGYDVRETDAGRWADEQGMHRDLAALLDFPDYYGRNLDALNDCMGEVATGAYGVRVGATGLGLVLWHFDAFAVGHRRAASQLLDIVTAGAAEAARHDRQLLCLVQSGS